MKKLILVLFLLFLSIASADTPNSIPVPISTIRGAPIIVYPPYNKIEDMLFPPQAIDDKGQIYYRFLAVPK